MLATVLFGGVAFGSPATDYIDTQLQIDSRLVGLHLHYTANIIGAQPDPDQALAVAQQEAQAVLRDAEALEEWAGGDQGLSAAVTQRAEHSVLWFEQTLPTMISLDSGPHPRDADQLQFETLLHLSEVTEIQDVDRINDALSAFAANNRILMEDPDLVLDPPEWRVELPGKPSALPCVVRVNFAIAHNNEMVILQDQVLDEWNAGIEMEALALIAHRSELEKAVKEIQAVPAWMGDATLTAALSANGQGLLELYGLMIQAAELDLRLFLFGKKRRQRDALVDQVNESVEPLNAAVQAAWTDFGEGWRIAERDQYLEELAQWTLEQGGLQ